MKSKRNFRTVISITLILMIMFVSTTVSLADTNQPKAIIKEGYFYYPSSKTTGIVNITWSHLHKNSSSTTDSVTYTTTRTQSSSANVSTNGVFKAMVAEVGVGYEVSWGTSRSVSTSITYGIPAYSTYLLRAGSLKSKAYGTEKLYERGVLKHTRSVSGEWTYRGYSDKIRK